jgi:hypothetical protein
MSFGRDGRHRLSTGDWHDASSHEAHGRARSTQQRKAWLAVALALLSLGCFAASASASTEEASPPIKLGGDPLTVYVSEFGRCQSSYPTFGGNYYPGDTGSIEEGGLADCGFFLATPGNVVGQPKDLQGNESESIKPGRVFGFDGQAGPGSFAAPTESASSNNLLYKPVSNVGPTGNGTGAEPFKVVTIYDAYVGTTEYFEVTQTTEYVSGNPYFTVNFDVKNVSKETAYYRAIYAGDLYVNGSDTGTGVFLAGPPRFVGGQNQTSGVLGGFKEDLQTFTGTPTPAWTSYAEDYWNTVYNEETFEPTGGIWHDVESSANATNAFPDSVSPQDWDNGAGVSWDTNYATGHGLAAGAEQQYAIVNYTTIPSLLQISPTSQGLAQGATATINVTATNSGGEPYANLPLRYTITGANPQSGVVNTNAQGAAQIHYVGTNAGTDLVSMYLDLGNSGSQTPADPTGTAQVTFVPAPPTSTVTIKSVKVNSDGSITITYVPTEAGTGTLTVTVPTASVARRHKAAKCKKGTIKIKGRCLPRTSVVGIAKGAGSAGVPLTLTVKPSGKTRHALGKGHTLHVVASLSYQSARGGTPGVHNYNLTLKGKRKHHKKRR